MQSAARELAAYQDEPKQLPSGAFGKSPFLRLGFEPRAERSVLDDAAPPRAVHRAAGALLGRGAARPALRLHHLELRRRPAGRPQHHRDRARGRRLRRTSPPSRRPASTRWTRTTPPRRRASDSGPAPISNTSRTRSSRTGARASRRRRAIEIDATATLVYSEVLMAGRKYYGDGETLRLRPLLLAGPRRPARTAARSSPRSSSSSRPRRRSTASASWGRSTSSATSSC